jgi:hypothetical protein
VFHYTNTELATIDRQLEPKLGWAKTRYAEAHQLALDATRLLTCSQDRLDDYRSMGFFKRVWSKLTGKTGDIQRANQADLLEAQKIAWRYLELLNERDLLQAQSMISIRNNLLTLATREEKTREEVARLADKVYERFVKLELRVEKLEAAQQIHGWLITIKTRDYDEKYPPHLRLLRVVNDFLGLKPGSWIMNELRYLEQALTDVKLDRKRSLSPREFLRGLVDEIEAGSSLNLQEVFLGDPSAPPTAFVRDQVSAPTYGAVLEIADIYGVRQGARRRDGAWPEVRSYLERCGPSLPDARLQLGMLAFELLDCMQLARTLFAARDAPRRLPEPTGNPFVSPDVLDARPPVDVIATPPIRIPTPDGPISGETLEEYVRRRLTRDEWERLKEGWWKQHSILSRAPSEPPDKLTESAQERWARYWQTKADETDDNPASKYRRNCRAAAHRKAAAAIRRYYQRS